MAEVLSIPIKRILHQVLPLILRRKIKEKWDNAYRITSLEYGDDTYMCIMSKYPGRSTDMQSYNINTNFKKELEKIQ